jgi:hypothetical protein
MFALTLAPFFSVVKIAPGSCALADEAAARKRATNITYFLVYSNPFIIDPLRRFKYVSAPVTPCLWDVIGQGGNCGGWSNPLAGHFSNQYSRYEF